MGEDKRATEAILVSKGNRVLTVVACVEDEDEAPEDEGTEAALLTLGELPWVPEGTAPKLM